jgi:hypothetical protein
MAMLVFEILTAVIILIAFGWQADHGVGAVTICAATRAALAAIGCA